MGALLSITADMGVGSKEKRMTLLFRRGLQWKKGSTLAVSVN